MIGHGNDSFIFLFFFDNAVLIIADANNYEEQKLVEALMEDKKVEDMNSVDNKKYQLKAEINSIINNIKSNEQLEAFKKLIAPARPTMAAIEKHNIRPLRETQICNNITPPSNKNISEQRCLYKTKKAL